MKAIIFLASLFLTFHSQKSIAQNIATQTISYNGWNLSVYRDQNTRQFTACSAGVRYNSGVHVLFNIGVGQRWQMGFGNPAWNLTRGQTINIQYYIDNASPRSGVADVIGKDLVNMLLPDNVQLFQQMRSGQVLYVNAAGQSFQFNLTGTSVVLQTLLRCSVSNGNDLSVQAPVQPAPPQASISPPGQVARPAPNANRVTPDQRLEATQFSANLLSQTGMRDVRLLTSSELRGSTLSEFFKTSDVVWRSDSVVGSLRIVSGRNASGIDTLASEIIADDARNCRGEFATGRTADPELPIIRRLQTFCTNAGGRAFNLAYLLLPISDDLIYQISTVRIAGGGDGDRQAIVAEDIRLRDAVRSVVSRSGQTAPVEQQRSYSPQGAAGSSRL